MKLKDAGLWKERGFIAGQWVAADSGQTTEIRNPANGELLGSVPHMGAAEARRAIDAAHAALPAWSKKTAGERARLMRKWFEQGKNAAVSDFEKAGAEWAKTKKEVDAAVDPTDFGIIKLLKEMNKK